MIERRHFVHSMIALGATTGLGPTFELFGVPPAGELDDLADAALASAKKVGATYADIRINRYRVQFIFTRDRRVQNIVNTEDYGFGIRVIVDGTWGFSSSSVVTKEEIARVTAQAAAIARANRKINAEAIQLAPVEAYNTTWNTPVVKNPFDMPIQPKLDLLLQVHEAALEVPGASFVSASMQFVNEDKYFASSEGSHVRQSLIRSYPNFSVTAVDKASGKFYSRRALTAPVGMGYEYVEGYPLLEEARVAAEEAVAMHKAKTVTPGLKQLILHPTNLWLTIHESVGHPTELDRALGYEANFAGTSFLTTDKLGKFEFGAKIVNLVADKTQDRALATCGYDDDGVKTSRWHLVKNGTVRGLSDHARSGARDRAEGVARVQLRRQLVVDSVPAHAQRLARAGREGPERERHHLRHRRWRLHQRRRQLQHRPPALQLPVQRADVLGGEEGQDHGAAARRRLPVEHHGLLEVVRPGRRAIHLRARRRVQRRQRSAAAEQRGQPRLSRSRASPASTSSTRRADHDLDERTGQAAHRPRARAEQG